MTESAFFACEAQRDCYKDLDVKQYKISATLDLKTSEICRRMDGKVFKMSEYQAGLTAPPFHPWCRSTTVPYFDDYIGERIARGKDGKTYYVPGDMTYNKWYDKYIDNALTHNDNESKIDIRKYNMNLKRVKQLEHIIGTKQWKNRVINDHKQGKSLPGAFRKNIDLKVLITQYAGTGTKKSSNNIYPKEFISIDNIIGIAYDYTLRKYVPTDRICIQYSSKGVHLYPVINNTKYQKGDDFNG